MNQLASPLALVAIAVLAVATLVGVVLVPGEALLPVHWGPDGAADAFWPRNFALAMPPLVVAILWIGLGMVLTRGREVERARLGLRTAFTGLAMLFAAIQAGTVAIGLGYSVDMVRVVALLAGLLFVGLGNIMPKSQPNSYSGFRVRWTLESPANWNATNRLAGTLMLLGGIALVGGALVTGEPLVLLGLILASTLVPCLVGVVFSYRFAQREKAARS